MYIRRLTPEQKKKLDEAERLLAEVQIEMLNEDEKLPKWERTGNWRSLYSVRTKLGYAVWQLWSD
jgi:hypothetical protein